ncbi:hypothetical protein Hte_002429 [Hypoxylon texense]
MAQKENHNPKESFNWIRREARGPTYVSYSELSDRLACSFEFGDNGRAASCNYGGELLNMSAIDEEQGIIFAHGNFESTYYASLARAQRHDGGKATFGLGIAASQDPLSMAASSNQKSQNYRLELGQMTERGCFNYRWPYNEYALLLHEEKDPGPKEIGTCARMSFVKDGILYQVMRLEKQCRPEANIYHYVPWGVKVALAIGGPIRFAAFNTEDSSAVCEGNASVEHDVRQYLRVSKDSTNQLEIRVSQLDGDRYDPLCLECPDSKGDDIAAEGPCYAYADLPDGRRPLTLVAEFRLQKADSQSLPWPETPTSAEIYDYLGVYPYSRMATGVMWETVFLKREQESNYFSELPEANLVGRCVEKILTVDLVPVAFKNKENLEFEETGPLTLVSNLFLRPSINLESFFWKLRFLVKTYRFLATFKQLCSKDTSPESSSNEASDGMDEAHLHIIAPNVPKIESHHYEAKSAWNRTEVIENTISWQMDRLKESIERSVAYLARSFIQPGTQTNLSPLTSTMSQSNYYYVMMTLWYVVKRCDPFEFAWKWVEMDGMKSWPSDDCLLAHCLPPDYLLPKEKEKEKVAFLKWYHYASVWNLCVRKKRTLLPKAWKMKNLDMKVNLLERDARRAAASKLSACQPYSAEDEILDRLGFLAEPLNAEFWKRRAGSVASLTVKRILDRDFTRYLHPGRHSDGEPGRTCGPWEVYALCHHSRLLVENYQYGKDDTRTRKRKAEDAEIYRRELFIFLSGEACLIPCWERTNMASFQSEATSVLASTLLGICQKDLLWNRPIDESSEPAHKQVDTNSTYRQLNTDSSHSNHKKQDIELDTHNRPAIETLLVRLEGLQKVKTTAPPAIEWMRYKPPRQYHHSNFFNSLDDTPELFDHSRKGSSRIVKRFLSSSLNIHGRDIDEKPLSELNEEGISIMLKRHKLTVIDLKASDPEPCSDHIWQGYTSETSTVTDDKSGNLDMTKKLSDSLVDQEVQHRTIILPTSSNGIFGDFRLLALFSCVIHVDSMDCFINHQSRFPDFSCQKGNTWVTRITLRSWSKSEITPEDYRERTNRPGTSKSTATLPGSVRSIEHPIDEEDVRILLPLNLRDSLKFINEDAFAKEEQSPGIVNLTVSSIVLSTNGFGDFSQCTIISELLDQDDVKKRCKNIWEQFIHQPQTARCLTFLAILGLLCQKMADDYRRAMKYFIQTTRIDVSKREAYWFRMLIVTKRDSIFDGKSLLQVSDPLSQLQLGLWSLESMFKLHNSLESSMRCIEEASVELRSQIHYGPGRRSECLERICQESLELFDRNLDKLVVLNAELNQKIELNNRYKDSLSTILSLEDSRNSIRQNSTIQKLTYLTIGYLPIGLITAIFAIPSDQNVLIPRMGLGGYVASVIILLVITFVVAMYMGQLLRGFGKLTAFNSSSSGAGGVPPPNSGNASSGDSGRYSSRPSTLSSRSRRTIIDVEQGKGE